MWGQALTKGSSILSCKDTFADQAKILILQRQITKFITIEIGLPFSVRIGAGKKMEIKAQLY
jgi:hypothetical protein